MKLSRKYLRKIIHETIKERTIGILDERESGLIHLSKIVKSGGGDFDLFRGGFEYSGIFAADKNDKRLTVLADISDIDLETAEGFTDNVNSKFGTNLAVIKGEAVPGIGRNVATTKHMCVVDLDEEQSFDLNSGTIVGGKYV